MNFKFMLGKMFPTIAKNSLVDTTIQYSQITRETTIPVVESVNFLVETTKPLPAEIEQFNDLFYKKYKMDYFSTVLKAVNNLVEISDYIEIALNDKFNEDITRTSMRLYHVNILKLLNLMGFVGDYARRAAVVHLVEFEKQSRNDTTKIIPSEAKFLNEYKWAYFAAINLFSQPVKSLIERLESLPEIAVNEDNIDVVSSTTNVDPLKMNFIVHPLNPVMFIGTRINLYRAKQYKQARADLEEVQARLHRINATRNGEADAKLDKQVEYYSNLSIKLKADVARMEKEYGIK